MTFYWLRQPKPKKKENTATKNKKIRILRYQGRKEWIRLAIA